MGVMGGRYWMAVAWCLVAIVVFLAARPPRRRL